MIYLLFYFYILHFLAIFKSIGADTTFLTNSYHKPFTRKSTNEAARNETPNATLKAMLNPLLWPFSCI